MCSRPIRDLQDEQRTAETRGEPSGFDDWTKDEQAPMYPALILAVMRCGLLSCGVGPARADQVFLKLRAHLVDQCKSDICQFDPEFDPLAVTYIEDIQTVIQRMTFEAAREELDLKPVLLSTLLGTLNELRVELEKHLQKKRPVEPPACPLLCI